MRGRGRSRSAEAVFDVADALSAAGAESSSIAVQQRIGGGSYSTIMRSLDDWKAQRQVTQQPAAAVPEAIVAHGKAFIQRLWIAAPSLAEQHLAQLRDDAQRQVAAVHTALATAEAAIARLVAEGEEQAQRLASQEQTIAALPTIWRRPVARRRWPRPALPSRPSGLKIFSSRRSGWVRNWPRPGPPPLIRPGLPANSPRCSGSSVSRPRWSSGWRPGVSSGERLL